MLPGVIIILILLRGGPLQRRRMEIARRAWWVAGTVRQPDMAAPLTVRPARAQCCHTSATGYPSHCSATLVVVSFGVPLNAYSTFIHS